MAVSFYKVKKWYKMLAGKSISHVSQGRGQRFSKETIGGYYNDLTGKVLYRDKKVLIPKSYVDTGEHIFFPIEIFQFGLGAYDLYLADRKKNYKEKVLACADWAVKCQQENGGWSTFSYANKKHPYSSMAQGEGISLLVRAYILEKKENYRIAAVKAKKFMLLPIENGGTTLYQGDDVYLYEFTYEPLVLNGWVFSLWGLLDYLKVFDDDSAQIIYNKSLQTMKKTLPQFDAGFWSRYELGKRISSPFYHKLLISQLEVMYELTGEKIFRDYADKFDAYNRNFIYRYLAFLIKALQKIFE